MKKIGISALGVMLGATTALAGGIERSAQSVAILFEKGNYLEFSVGRVAPEVSGTQQISAGAMSLAGSKSGDMADDYNTYGLGLKMSLGEQFDVALIMDEPVGADVNYPAGASPAGLNYLYGGSTADINSVGTTALVRYRMPNNFSLIGGVRQIRTSGKVSLFNGYNMSSSTETDYGYVLGVAWEKPEIAARVALTYNSAVTHDFTANENGVTTTFETEIPQSVLLEGQTGIAANTLLFGSVRWVDWSAFEIAPTLYVNNPSNVYNEGLVSYSDDVVTYTLGVGRKFNDVWSGAVFASYEASHDGYSGNLGPTNGSTALGAAVSYTRNNMKITAGLRYVLIGDAETEIPSSLGNLLGTCNTSGDDDCGTFGKFTDNHAVAWGIRVGYSF